MTESKPKCPHCGAVLDAAGMAGLCPRCVALDFFAPQQFGPDSELEEIPELLAADERRIGGYELMEELGRGGMGVVYRARQLELGREVAIKFLLHGVLAGDSAIARFRAEAEAVAHLRHPNIVTVYEVGTERGRQYFTMELIRGHTLGEILREGSRPARWSAGCVKKVAEALHYAHSRRVLHRDLKPDNVLVDEQDEPRVTDFGLAKRFDSGTDLTLSGQVLGTPAYLSPEQAGAGETLDCRSDVYSLGATLYHLVTGRPPFVGESPTHVLRQVADAEPVAPRLLNPALPRDLETICLKCLEKDPARRYASALELAEDLDRFLNQEPVRARPVGAVERGWRWCKRKPALAGAFAGILLLLAGIAGVSSRDAKRIEGLRLEALRNLYASDMRLAGQAILESKFGVAAELLERHRPQPGDPDLRGFEWRYFHDCCRSEETAALGAHDAQVQRVAFSPDGSLVATAAIDVQVWEVATRRRLCQFVAGDFVWALAFTPEGGELLLARGNGSVVRLNPRAASPDPAKATPPQVVGEVADLQGRPVAFSCASQPAATRIILQDGILSWDGVSAKCERVARFESPFSRAQVSLDGRSAAVLSGPFKVALWKLYPPALVGEFGVPVTTRSVAVSPDGANLASGDYAGQIHIWHLGQPETTNVIAAHRGMIECLAFSPDGRRLASAGVDQIIRLHDAATGARLGEWHGHRATIMALAFAPNGQTLVSGDKEGAVKLWDLAQPRQSAQIVRGDRGLLSTEGLRAVTLDGGGTAESWVLTQAAVSHQPIALPRGWWPLPAAHGLAAFDALGGLHSLQSDGTWRKHELPGLTLDRSGVLSPDGRWICLRALGISGPVVWDLNAERELFRITNEPTWLAPTFSADGRRLACGSAVGRVCVWEIPTGREIAALAAHRNYAYACDLSPDGRRLASAGFDGVVKLWEVDPGVLMGEFRSTADAYWSVGLAPDGLRLAAGTSEASIVMWDVPTRHEVATFQLGGPLRPVEGLLRFAPDGNRLVCALDSLRWWNAPPLDRGAAP